MKTRAEINNLRHSSLRGNLKNVHRKFQVNNVNNNRDIHVQKIKVKNIYFIFITSLILCLIDSVIYHKVKKNIIVHSIYDIPLYRDITLAIVVNACA